MTTRRTVQKGTDWMLGRALEILDATTIELTDKSSHVLNGAMIGAFVFGQKETSGKMVVDLEGRFCLHTDKRVRDLTFETTADLYGELARTMRSFQPTTIGIIIGNGVNIVPTAVGVSLALFEPEDFKTDLTAYAGPKDVYIVIADDSSIASYEMGSFAWWFKRGLQIGGLCNLQRWLGALPCQDDYLNANNYNELVQGLVKSFDGEVLYPSIEEYDRMGLMNAVSAAIGDEWMGFVPAFIVHPLSGATSEIDVFVGKGLTYDTGGVQDKGEHMPGMMLDMMGSAAVLCAGLDALQNPKGLKKTTVFVLGITENRDGSMAYLPNSVLTAFNGKTVEVTHTDAEGRLVLADAMAWICKRMKSMVDEGASRVTRVVTIATLTGSAANALSTPYTAMFVKGDDQEVLTNLRRLGETCGDLVWPMPMSHPHYGAQMAGDRSDLRNTGKIKEGGASQAAAFLANFLPEGYEGEYLHLDIAGSTDIGMKGNKATASGLPQDAGVRFLIELMRNNEA